jgi:hypothetical protein
MILRTAAALALIVTTVHAEPIAVACAAIGTKDGQRVLSAAEFILPSPGADIDQRSYQEDAGKFVIVGDNIVFVPADDVEDIESQCKEEGGERS